MKHSKPASHLYGVGSLAWRRSRDLLGIRDLIRDYAAARAPRGAYRVPMRNDLVHGVRE